MFIVSRRIVFVVVFLDSLSFITPQQQLEREDPKRIAIIGGGIGGSSASYFVRDKFGEDVDIDLFEESSKICGRLATVSIAGREYESGGSIIHPRNEYMKMFVESIPGLEKADKADGTLGFFDGNDYLLRTSRWSIITLLQMFWNFGFDITRVQSLEDKFITKFERIYELQDRGLSFNNVSSLLHGMAGDEFVHATQISAEELFAANGVSQFTIDNLITPALRNNYGQTATANGFVGAVAMAGIQSGLWSVKGGNKKVCKKLILESSVTLIHEKVTSVRYNSDDEDGRFSVLTSGGFSRSYDIVIIAAPITRKTSDFIDVSQACSNRDICPGLVTDEREYRRTVANFVHGRLNHTLFKCTTMEECPTFFMIPNQDTFYRSIGIHVPVDYDSQVDEVRPVYKVFTTEPLTDEQRNYLFEAYNETATVDWLAYPHYQPPDKLDSFVLNSDGLYYTSPIEWAASAMEMSVISAKNAALLAFNNWRGIEPNLTHEDDMRSRNEDL